jgi:hypothetical protein
MSMSIAADAGLFDTLNGIPNVDIPGNLRAAISTGRRMTSILREVISLRRGAGEADPERVLLLPALGSGPEPGGEAPLRGQAGAAPDAPHLQRLRLLRRCGRQAALPNSDGGRTVACAPFARRHAGMTADRGSARRRESSRNRPFPARAADLPAIRQTGRREIQPLRHKRRTRRRTKFCCSAANGKPSRARPPISPAARDT